MLDTNGIRAEVPRHDRNRIRANRSGQRLDSFAMATKEAPRKWRARGFLTVCPDISKSFDRFHSPEYARL